MMEGREDVAPAGIDGRRAYRNRPTIEEPVICIPFVFLCFHS